MLFRSHALYLFALVRAGSTEAAQWADSPDFAPPIEHRAGLIGALASVVPLSHYSGPGAAKHLGDAAWITPRTVYHAAMLRQAMGCSPVFPAPFATLYASLDSLAAFILANEEPVLRFFRSVEGMEEWELRARFCLSEPATLEEIGRAHV